MSIFGGAGQSQSQFKSSLNKVFIWYGGGFAAFVIVLAVLEQIGMPKEYIGYAFLAATVLLYGGIGVMSRTNDAAEYYVAGRRVPAMYNGMATGSDWMSAASFIGMAGSLYALGYGGLAFILGWTGGYMLVAILLGRIVPALNWAKRHIRAIAGALQTHYQAIADQLVRAL